MRILLDTRIALWAVIDSLKLPATARMLIEDIENSPWVSAASVWEILIKHPPMLCGQLGFLEVSKGDSRVPLGRRSWV